MYAASLTNDHHLWRHALVDGEALDSQGHWVQNPAAYSVYYNVVRFVRAVGQ